MTFFLLFTATLSGAFLYRARGGGLMTLPRPLEQMLFGIVFIVFMCVTGVPIVWQLLAWILCIGAVLTGHGQYFLYEFRVPNLEAIEPERFDFILWPFFGRDPRTDEKYLKWRRFDPTQEPDDNGMTMENYHAAMTEIEDDMDEYGHKKMFWRCVAGYAVTGFLVSMAPGIAVMTTTPNMWLGLALALSGFIAKPLAYVLSHHFGHGTHGGEWGYGGLQWFIATVLAVLVFA